MQITRVQNKVFWSIFMYESLGIPNCTEWRKHMQATAHPVTERFFSCR